MRKTIVTWQGRLDRAHNEREVVEATREFIARITPAEIARLPDECRPHKLVDANDVAEYALSLGRAQHGDVKESRRSVAKLCAFLTAASTRLSQLAPRPAGSDD